MMPVLYFLLTFGSCASQGSGTVDWINYKGYEQTIERGFIGNYVYDLGSGTSKWLTSPAVFKLTVERDTLFMYTSGHGYVFTRNKHSMKCYSGFVGQNKIKFTIRESDIEATMPDLRTLRIVNKSML